MTIMARKHSTTVNVAEAKARLAELLRRVDAGEEIVIARDHKPVARLVSARLPGSRKPGSARGLFTMAPDFDAPLPDFEEYER
jgi:prevent-host-death family protein